VSASSTGSSTFAACDLCGAGDAVALLRSPRLDGPLVRCRRCGLVYVGRRRADYTFDAADEARSRALASRVADLGLVRPGIEEAERPWREAADRERLARLTRHLSAGTLLDVGCATGTFLAVAGESGAAGSSRGGFDVVGVEPDPGTSELARRAGHRVITGTLDDVRPPPGGFDAITMFHVIEHLDSPRRAVLRARELLRPGGVLMIETPTVDCLWFRHAPRHWRQLIPDHYFLFGRETLEQLLRRCELEPLAYEKVSRRVSARFLVDRLRRAGMPAVDPLSRALRRLGLDDSSVRVNPGDIMTVIARRRG
jgi:SAM-dependent methyltransferase